MGRVTELSEPLKQETPLAQTPKKKRCIVFAEPCSPVTEVPTLGEAMDVLRDAHLALILVFCAGWVHRDVSAGNVLAVKKGTRDGLCARLVDMEFSKKFPSDDDSPGPLEIGTPYFLAVEIQSFESFYSSPEADPFGYDQIFKPSVHVSGFVEKHTYSHDIESLWWLVLWILTNHVGHEGSYRAAYDYFQQNDIKSRRLLLKNAESKAKIDNWNADLPILHPDLRAFIPWLNGVRAVLFAGYKHRHPETDLKNLKTYKSVCAAYAYAFDAINQEEKRATWETVKLYPAFI